MIAVIGAAFLCINKVLNVRDLNKDGFVFP